jgi:hypothetical protein
VERVFHGARVSNPKASVQNGVQGEGDALDRKRLIRGLEHSDLARRVDSGIGAAS